VTVVLIIRQKNEVTDVYAAWPVETWSTTGVGRTTAFLQVIARASGFYATASQLMRVRIASDRFAIECVRLNNASYRFCPS
jgi:hypothetical protein